MFTFSIEQWHSWAPQLTHAQAWKQWAHAPVFPPPTASTAPALDFLAPMQRRRLSPLARAVFSCAWPLVQVHTRAPMVFASRHGETSRTLSLLQTLAAGEGLSPTAFCLSVHNAIAAQWAMIRQDTSESVALSAEGDGLEHAFLEAALLLAEGHAHVLVVLAEDTVPAPYAAQIADVPTSYAIAFALCAGADWRLSLRPAHAHGAAHESPFHEAQEPLVHLPNPLNLIRHLLLGTPQWQHTHGTRQWHWTRLAQARAT